MKRAWSDLLVRSGALAGLVVAIPGILATSCAATDEEGAGPGEQPATIPDAAASDADSSADGGGPNVPCSGTAWCSVSTGVSPLFVLKSVWGSSKNDVWAAGSGGAVVHFDGTNWTTVTSGVTNTFNAIWGSGAGDVYFVAGADTIFHSTGFQAGNAALTPLPVEGLGLEGTRVNTIWGSSATDIRLGTDFYFYLDMDANVQEGSQFVLAQADGKAAWNPAAISAHDEPDTVVRSIWGAASDDVWMVASQLGTVGREAIAFHGRMADGTMVFDEVDSQSSSPLESIHGTSAKDVWAVGAGGTIRHFGDGDTRWQPVSSPTSSTLHAVWASSPNDVWAVGDNATIIHYDGKSFTVSAAELTDSRKPTLYGIWGSGPNDVWIVGDAIALHYTGGVTSTGGTP